MSTEGSLGPCERFAVLATRRTEITACDVCDHLEAAHDTPGRRVLSGSEIEVERKRILMERFDQQQRDRDRTAHSGPKISTNGDPEHH